MSEDVYDVGVPLWCDICQAAHRSCEDVVDLDLRTEGAVQARCPHCEDSGFVPGREYVFAGGATSKSPDRLCTCPAGVAAGQGALPTGLLDGPAPPPAGMEVFTGKRQTKPGPKAVLAAHIAAMHRRPPPKRATLAELQQWHATQHHRLRLNHFHAGPNLGPEDRPPGWRTGEDAVERT